MKILFRLMFIAAISGLVCAQEAPPLPIHEDVPPPSNNYVLGPDSQPHPGVPAGKTFTFEMTDSKIFPATLRTITVYVPAAYHADHPACVYVGLDGLGFHAPVVFDNLIAQHAMPVTIAVGIAPGRVDSARAPENPRFDRSFEFDSLTNRFARFVIEEVLPAVEKRTTPSGERIVLSHNPNDRAAGGGSTGAIGAFTLAWERPDEFRRVFSSIGTYVGMRGGERYNVLVRKTEPKPIRIFMQDGVHDEWPGGPEMGDWWMSNQTMERALEFAGYDVRHVWGAGTHNGKQADSLFPEAMRWLWRDWPKPITAGAPGNPALKPILLPNEYWQVAAEGCPSEVFLASNAKGAVFAPGPRAGTTAAISEGKCPPVGAGPLVFEPGGKFYPGNSIAGNLQVSNLTVREGGDVYVTTRAGEIWRMRARGGAGGAAGGEKERLEQGLRGPSGIAFSPDGLWLFVAQRNSRWGYSYRVRTDGTLDAKEPFYDFAVPGDADDSGASSVWMDREGLAYVATRLGVQIFDNNGRVIGILPMPGNAPATSLCFGGDGFQTLYVASAGKIYKRKLHSIGVPPGSAPIKLPRRGAG